jgi:hypothetical protein
MSAESRRASAWSRYVRGGRKSGPVVKSRGQAPHLAGRHTSPTTTYTPPYSPAARQSAGQSRPPRGARALNRSLIRLDKLSTLSPKEARDSAFGMVRPLRDSQGNYIRDPDTGRVRKVNIGISTHNALAPQDSWSTTVGPVKITALDVGLAGLPGVGLGGDLVKTAGRGAVEAGASALAKKGAEDVGGQAAKDVGGQTAKESASKLSRARNAVKERPRPVKAAKAKVAETKPAQAVRSAAETKPARLVRKATRTATAPARVVGEHKAATMAALATAAAASGAKNKGNIKGAAAPFIGIGKALEHPRTYVTTLEGAPGLVTAPLGIAEGLGLTAGRAASSAAHSAHIPGAKAYSGKEIATPTTEQAKQLADYGKSLAGTYGSGDPNKIEHATEHDFGLWPLAMAGFPGAKAAEKLGVGRAIKAAIPEPITSRIEEAVGERRHRRREAHKAAQHQTREHLSVRGAVHPIQTAIERVKGTKRLTHHRKTHVEPGDTVATMVAEGIPLDSPNAAKHLSQLQRSYPHRPDVSAEAKVPHDVVNALASGEHARFGRSTKYREGLAAARAKAKELEQRGPERYVRAKYFHQAKTWGVALPEERFAPDVEALNKSSRAAQLRINGVPPPEIARTLDVPEPQVKTWLSQSAEDRVRAAKKLEKKQTAAFERDMIALRNGRLPGKAHAKGLREPFYVRDVPVDHPDVPVAGRPGLEQQSYAMHQKTGKLRAAGKQDMSFDTYLRESVARPRRIAAKHQEVERFAREDNISIPATKKLRGGKTQQVKRTAVTSAEFKAAASGDHPQIDPDNVMLVDSSKWNQALHDPNLSADERVTLEQEALDQQRILRDMEDPTHKGRKYLIKPRAKAEEWVAQHTPREAGIGQRIWRWPMHAVLAYSPPWLLSQPIAEGSIAALSKNPLTQIVATRAAKGKGALPFTKDGEPISEAARQEVAAHAGSTAGTGWRSEDRETSNKLTESLAQLKRSRTGRTAWDLLTGEAARTLDLWKGGKINEGQFLAKAYHELGHGPVRKVGRALRLIEPLDAELQKAGGNFAKEVEILSRRSKDMEQIANYVYDTHGDWNSIIKSGKFNEKFASDWLTFYPFLRFSTLWYLRYGRQHPGKAAALAFLANENEQALRKLYGGAPDFPTGWANAPIYAGRGKNLGEPTKSLGPIGARVTPTSNALTEMVMRDTGPGGLLNALNPWVGNFVSAATGVNPLSGRQEGNGWPGWSEFAKDVVVNTATYPQLARAADQFLSGKKVSRKLAGKDVTRGTLIWDVLSGNATDPKGTALRSTFGVFLPSSTAKDRQKALLARLYDRAYGGLSDNSKDPIGDAIQRANDALASGNGGEAKQNVVHALDALVAKNQIDKLAVHLGIPSKDIPSSQGQRGALVSAQLGSGQYSKGWNTLMKLAIDAGLSPHGLYERERRLAFEIMGPGGGRRKIRRINP